MSSLPSPSSGGITGGQSAAWLSRPDSLLVPKPSLAGVVRVCNHRQPVFVVSATEVRLPSGVVSSVAPDVRNSIEQSALESAIAAVAAGNAVQEPPPVPHQWQLPASSASSTSSAGVLQRADAPRVNPTVRGSRTPAASAVANGKATQAALSELSSDMVAPSDVGPRASQWKS